MNIADLTAGLILAVGGAGLLAALAFRQLIDSVIKLNTELQNTVHDRQTIEAEREQLRDRVAILEDQIAALEAKITALEFQLHERDLLIASLQTVH